MTTYSLPPNGGETLFDLPSISSAEASLASRSASEASSGAWLTSDGSGRPSSESYALYDPASRSWKTSQPYTETLWPSDGSSVTFTRSGSMRSGRCYERLTWVRPMPVNGFSSWPTPRASMGSHGICWSRAETGDHRSQLEDYLAWMWLRSGHPRISGLLVNPEWTDWVMGFEPGWTASGSPVTLSSLSSPSTSGES